MSENDAQFIPGPWFIGKRTERDRSQEIVNQNQIVVAEVFGIFDGRLIAAAPDLYRLACAVDRPEIRQALSQTLGEKESARVLELLGSAKAKVEGRDLRLYQAYSEALRP